MNIDIDAAMYTLPPNFSDTWGGLSPPSQRSDIDFLVTSNYSRSELSCGERCVLIEAPFFVDRPGSLRPCSALS